MTMHNAAHYVLVVLVLVSLQPLCCRSVHKGPSKRNYDKLELHLQQHTASRDIVVNMKEIRRLHEELSKPLSLEYDPQLMEATKDFIQLDELPMVDAQCNEREHQILRRFDRITDSHMYHLDLDLLTSIELVAYYKIQAYSTACLPRYAERFREKPKMEGNADLLVDMFFDQMWPRKPEQDEEKYSATLFYRFIGQNTRPQTQKETLKAAEFVRDRVLEEDSQARFSHYLSSSDYRKYLQEPCQKYRKHYGPELLDLALFDGEMFTIAYLVISYGSGGLPYMKALAQYKFCETIISDRSNFSQTTVKKLKELDAQKEYIDQVQTKRARGESSGTFAYSKDGDTLKFL